MRAVLCHCHRRLEAEDEGALCALVRDHLKTEHAAIRPTDEQVGEVVSTRAYDIERVEIYAGAEGPAEDFGPEPY